MEIGSRRSEVGGRKSEVRGLTSEVGSRRSGVRDQGHMERKSEQIRSARDLRVYQKAYSLAMDIFQLSKGWPMEEKYSLTDQVRRSSRSVCANLREAWAKRRYEAHFISKLTDADGENSETNTWLDFALDCRYLNQVNHHRLTEEAMAIGSMLGAMLKNPYPFLLSKNRSQHTDN